MSTTAEKFKAYMEEHHSNAVRDVAVEAGIESVMDIDGVYECLAEEFNNAAIKLVRSGWDDDFGPRSLEAIEGCPNLTREACVRLLEAESIECRDEEGVEVLREAVASNVHDGTIDPDDVLGEL